MILCIHAVTVREYTNCDSHSHVVGKGSVTQQLPTTPAFLGHNYESKRPMDLAPLQITTALTFNGLS